MTLPDSADDIFAEAMELSRQISELSESDPRYKELESRRATLRSRANSIAIETRHPVSVNNEIEMLVARWDEIDSTLIGKGYAEKHLTKGFSDPGAYSAGINALIAEDHASEIEYIKERLVELRSIQTAKD